MTPSNEEEMWKMLTTGLNFRGIGAVRYPRGFTEGLDLDLSDEELEIGKSKTIVKGKKIAYLVFGTLLNTVLKLAKKNGATVIDMRFVKPIDENIIISACQTHEYIFTVEDNVILGGAGSAVNEVVHKNNIKANIINLGVPDNIVSHGSQNEIFADLGLDVHGLENQTNDHIKKMEDLNNNRRNVKGK
jgi:1-deoxy-D-xylulose-5-phosphate synthase